MSELNCLVKSVDVLISCLEILYSRFVRFAPKSGCFGTSCLTISGLGLSIHGKDQSRGFHEGDIELMFINHGAVLR